MNRIPAPTRYERVVFQSSSAFGVTHRREGRACVPSVLNQAFQLGRVGEIRLTISHWRALTPGQGRPRGCRSSSPDPNGIAAIVNQRGHRSYDGKPFTRLLVRALRRSRQLEERFDRLQAVGLLTPEELTSRLQICRSTLNIWRRRGLLRAYPCHDHSMYLYEPPPDDLPAKGQHKPRTLLAKTSGGAV